MLKILHEFLCIIRGHEKVFVPVQVVASNSLTVVFHVRENPEQNRLEKSLTPEQHLQMLKQKQREKLLAERKELMWLAKRMGYKPPQK